MESSFSFNFDKDFYDKIKQAAKLLELPIEETIERLIGIGVDTVLDENIIPVEVSDEMFDDIERRLSPGAKQGITDSFWEGEADEKEVIAAMKARREKDE